MACDFAHNGYGDASLYQFGDCSMPQGMGSEAGYLGLLAKFPAQPRKFVPVVFLFEYRGHTSLAGVIQWHDPTLRSLTYYSDIFLFIIYALRCKVAKFLRTEPCICQKLYNRTLLFGSYIEDFPILFFGNDSLFRRLRRKILDLCRCVRHTVIIVKIGKKRFYGD